MGFSKYKILLYGLLAYMLAAFVWWAILLSKNNRENYTLKKQLSQYEKNISESEVQEVYQAKKNMIIGEGLVFGISLLIGLYLIHKAYWKEIENNKKQNNFLLSVTHELKTPITSLNLINKTLTEKNIPTEKSKLLLQSAYSESKRLESLVDNILTAAEMEQEYTYNLERIDITELITERCKMFENTFGVEIKKEVVSELFCEVDREAFIKLIDNLISNAIKYSPHNKTISIQLSHSANSAIIKVADNGIGIPAQERKKVLDKFYRIGSEETRETKGTGLGLYIANEIVMAHQGTMTIVDNNPVGTIFNINLPTL